MARPLVGLSARPVPVDRLRGWRTDAAAGGRLYVDALDRAGAAVALLPAVAPAAVPDLVAHLDGLLLQGGGDLNPSTYGQEAVEKVYGVDDATDAFELALVRAAIAARVPTLAVCRGIQVLNVACGGSLHQHIGGRTDLADHGTPGLAGGGARTPVRLDPGSLVAVAAGATEVVGSCHHHQALDRIGEGLVVTGRAPDGIVEAVQHGGPGWVVGVQWHPEDTAATDPAQQGLFAELVRRAAAP